MGAIVPIFVLGTDTHYMQVQPFGADLVIPGHTTLRVMVNELTLSTIKFENQAILKRLRNGTKVQVGLSMPPDSRTPTYVRVNAVLQCPTPATKDAVFTAQFTDPPADLLIVIERYLKQQQAIVNQILDLEVNLSNKRSQLNIISMQAAGQEAIDLLDYFLEQAASTWARQEQFASNDVARSWIQDDVLYLRRACNRDNLPQKLALELLRLKPKPKSNMSFKLTLVGYQHTTKSLVTQDLVETLNIKLAEPLRQMHYRLQELQLEATGLPFAPHELVASIESELTKLHLSDNGLLHCLRSIAHIEPRLENLYYHLLAAWESMA
ncbi:hypothetical protein TI04_07770 [Achromatium sp. WMS2]|nr:hypothetical protein TI04_07770 [Achromatium sp. WMS2]